MEAIADYYDGMDAIKEDSGNPDIFKISPSSVEDFFSSTSQYYHEQVLGEEKAFQGSTSTHLGTIVHALAEATVKNEDMSNVEDRVEEFLASIEDPNVDKDLIRSLWFPMGSLLVTETVLKDDVEVVGTEDFLFHKINDDVYVGGTYDSLIKDKADYSGTGLCVVDYKTAGTKPSGINKKYRWQAYTYAYMLTKAGHNITAIQLSFVVRPTKTLPVRYFEFKEPYTEENHAFIESLLNLVAESVSMFKSEPKLRHLLAQDARLRETPKPTAFPASNS